MTEKISFATLPDRAVMTLKGPDAPAFLQGLLTKDVNAISPDQSIYTALLTPQGKVLFDFFIAQTTDGFLLDVEAARQDAALKRLSLYKLRAKVDIAPAPDWRVAAIFNDTPDRDAAPGATRPHNGSGARFADPRCAALGTRLIAPTEEIAGLTDECRETDAAAYNARRLDLGVPACPEDIRPEVSFPLDANLDMLNAIDFQKGCYVGQEVTSRMKRKAALRKRTLVLDFDGPPPPPGAPVTAGAREIGTVLSGTMGRALALIRLDRWSAAEEDGATPAADGRPVRILRQDWLKDDAS
ncbi:MAG: folate-binding protein [Pseudomonadota bacterium]